eukprot:c8500_g1_i1.p1 GENE.c8500_g1_i1~~c8500_g1_i1.p1  ORF type:complete len:347 (+),score=79.69 c8500_g1_i1:37-1077(+)
MQSPFVPVLDVSVFADNQDPERAQQTAQQLAQAIASTGAFYITGHGIPDTQESAIFGAAQQFFALDEDVKQSIPIQKGGFTRGYVNLGGESGSHRLEVKEAFSYGYDWPESDAPTNALQGPNKWPPETLLSREWQNEMKSFYTAMIGAAERVVRGLSLALGFDKEYLASYCTQGDTISLMRAFHYFPAQFANQLGDQYADKERIGSSPHTDWGFITLVLQDQVGGLEVFQDDEWHPIPPIPGTILVNCGDYLALLSGNKVISPLHRVVPPPPGPNRLSFVLFYYPNYESKIPPLAGASPQALSLLTNQRESDEDTGTPTNQTGVEEVSFGEYIARKWDQVFRSAKR